MTLNQHIEQLVKLQLHNHGNKPICIMLADGTRLQLDKVWDTHDTLNIQLIPEIK